MDVVGLSTFGEALALASPGLLPSGTDRYLMLFEEVPQARDGTGGTESSDASYARVTFSNWSTAIEPDRSVRSNGAVATFPALAAGILYKGFGIADALTVGNVLFSAYLTDVAFDIISGGVNYIAGDEVSFAIDQIRVALKNEE